MENLVLNYTDSEDAASPGDFVDWGSAYPLSKIIRFGVDSLCATTGALGVFGNFVTMLIISKWKNMSSGAAFMFSLALSDFLSVIYNGFIDMARPLFGWTITGLSDWVCKFSMYWSFATSLASFYATVLFSADKCTAVMFPFFYRQHGKPKVAIIATVIMYFLLLVWTFPTVLVFRVHPLTGFCRAINFDFVSEEFFRGLRNQIGSFINGIIPITSVFLFTTITLIKMKILDRKRAANRSQTTSPAGRRDQEITRQMIVVCIIFTTFGFVFAVCIRVLLGLGKVMSYKDEMRIQILLSIVRLCQAVMNSVNFYLYLLFGQKFRKNFFELFPRGNTRTQRESVASNPNKKISAPVK
ncbi:FMRFamide receptor-like isoform X2 [Symsagittifera roscoffensis]|uniref:FMRFamide receptor-like isoform X2 n=1 Tax=Symsagittifera roscoffensis TaxID=84072 RepID=UPI00307C9185